jgi:hypothetical protein
MGSSSQMYKPNTSWHKVQNTAEDHRTPPICRVHQTCAKTAHGLCYSSKGSKIGVRAYGKI